MLIRPTFVQALPNYQLYLEFSDGTKGEADLSELAGKGLCGLFWADHPPPHFHAIYGEHEAHYRLGARSLVGQWIDLHRAELIE